MGNLQENMKYFCSVVVLRVRVRQTVTPILLNIEALVFNLPS
jgi:hypothetical protein